MNILFFDTETTGLPGRPEPGFGQTHSSDGQPRLVNLAWLKHIDNKATGACDMLVRPDGFHMPPRATMLTGITEGMLLVKGLDEKIVLDAFMLAVRGADLLVGHNIAFDIAVVASRLRAAGRDDDAALLESRPSFCTMESSTDLCRLPKSPDKRYDYDGEYKYPRLSELHRFLFKEDFESAHTALADVKATARCYFELKKRGLTH